MRFQAVTNNVPDYYIYHNGKYVETLEGEFLYNLYSYRGFCGYSLAVRQFWKSGRLH